LIFEYKIFIKHANYSSTSVEAIHSSTLPQEIGEKQLTNPGF